jgi:signal transduction histidine kinase
LNAEELTASDKQFRRSLLGVLIAGLVALMAMALIAGVLMVRSQSYNRWVEHTYVVQSIVAQLEAVVERAETARRGYLLYPDAAYKEAYELAEREITAKLNRLAIETLDNPSQIPRVARLRRLTTERSRRVAQMMSYASRGEIDAAVESFRGDRDQPLLFEVRTIAAQMLSEEQRLLQLRIHDEVVNSEALFTVVIIGGSLLTLLSVGASTLMRRYANDLGAAQSALKTLNAELEARVLERTAELSRANEEIQRFAYIVSHDLRSPLVNVMGFTTELEVAAGTVRELITDLEVHEPGRVPAKVTSALDVDLPEAIGFIRASSQKMDNLIKAILRLSREGRRTMSPELLDMDALAAGLFANVRHRLLETGAEGVVEGALPPLTADRLAVDQIFGNLIDNAVKYLSPARPGKIVFRGRREGRSVVFEVEDNGRGIDPKDHERIFELFRRSGPQDRPGEGIGLAHVRALVYRLGGSIDCVSELGRGALFRVSFPER